MATFGTKSNGLFMKLRNNNHLCFVKILIISFSFSLRKLSEFCQNCTWKKLFSHLAYRHLITHTDSIV